MRAYLEKCPCGSGLEAYPEYDGHGCFLFYGCDKCTAKKLKGYRSDIKEFYDCDEPIEPEE